MFIRIWRFVYTELCWKKYNNDNEAIKDIMKKEIGYYVFYCEKKSEGLFKPLSILKKECDSRLPSYIDYAKDNLSPQQDRNLLIIACNKMKSINSFFNCKELKMFEHLVILEYQSKNVDEYPLPNYIKKIIKESIENKDFMQK